MEGHLEQAISTIDKQFGADTGFQMLPSNKPIVMNKVSSLDAMYEIIVDGYILGRLRFDIPKQGYTFLPTLEGARRLGRHSRVGWVSCYDEVLPYLKKGANLMLPGIAGCDLDIKVDDEVWIINSSGLVIGVGVARMSERDTQSRYERLMIRRNHTSIKRQRLGMTLFPAISLISALLKKKQPPLSVVQSPVLMLR